MQRTFEDDILGKESLNYSDIGNVFKHLLKLLYAIDETLTTDNESYDEFEF